MRLDNNLIPFNSYLEPEVKKLVTSKNVLTKLKKKEKEIEEHWIPICFSLFHISLGHQKTNINITHKNAPTLKLEHKY